jgi:hypothetical protein
VDHFYDDEDLFSGLAEAAVARLPFFHPADLAALAWAFSQLRYSHGGLLHEVLAHAAAHAQQFSIQEVAGMVWACARLQQDAPAQLRAVGNHVAAQLVALSGAAPPGPGGEPSQNRHAGHSIHIHSDGSLTHEMEGALAGLTGGFTAGKPQQRAGGEGGAMARSGALQHGSRSAGFAAGVSQPQGALRQMARSGVRQELPLHEALVQLCWSFGALRHMHQNMMTQAYRCGQAHSPGLLLRGRGGMPLPGRRGLQWQPLWQHFWHPSCCSCAPWSHASTLCIHTAPTTHAHSPALRRRELGQHSESEYSDGELALLQQAQMMALEMSGAGAVNHPQLAESITIWQNARCRGQSCKLALPGHLQARCCSGLLPRAAARAAATCGVRPCACRLRWALRRTRPA